MNGEVQQFNKARGFGFLLHGFKNRVFFHVSNWKSDVEPEVGMAVTFDTAPSGRADKPDQAVNVVPAAEGSTSAPKAGN